MNTDRLLAKILTATSEMRGQRGGDRKLSEKAEKIIDILYQGDSNAPFDGVPQDKIVRICEIALADNWYTTKEPHEYKPVKFALVIVNTDEEQFVELITRTLHPVFECVRKSGMVSSVPYLNGEFGLKIKPATEEEIHKWYEEFLNA